MQYTQWGRMFFASDELYMVAGGEVPPRTAYEEFPQHENGIGMVRTFTDEVAAVMVEPIQGEGGINSATQEYLANMRTLLE